MRIMERRADSIFAPTEEKHLHFKWGKNKYQKLYVFSIL